MFTKVSLTLFVLCFNCHLTLAQIENGTIERVERLAKSLKERPSNWKILVQDEPTWKRQSQQPGVARTQEAFSIRKKRITIIRASFVNNNMDFRVKRTLAHEAGHIFCDCNDESRADKIADSLISR